MKRVTLGLGAALVLAILSIPGREAGAVPTGDSPFGVGVNAATDRIYVSNTTARTVSVIAGDASQVIATIPMPAAPMEVAVNRATNRIYVVLHNTNNIAEIDGDTNSIAAMIPVGHDSNGLTVNPATNRIYATDGIGDTLSVIDGATRAVVARISAGTTPEGVGVNPTSNRIFVVNTGGSLSIINGATDRVIDTIPLELQPRQVGIDVKRNLAYVTNSSADYVWLIDGRTRTVITTIRVKTGPLGIAVNSETNRVYVANILQDSLSIIRGSQHDVSTVRVGHSPARVGVNEITGVVYVSNAGNDNVSVYSENDLLRNGSFDRERDRRPVSWTSQNLGAGDEPVGGDFSQFPYDGKWAFQFVGQAGVDKRLMQTVARVRPAGSTFQVEGFSEAEDASSVGRYEIEVTLTFTDNTSDVFRVQFPGGTHDWLRRARAFVAPRDVMQARTSVIYADQTGRAWFDAVHLNVEGP